MAKHVCVTQQVVHGSLLQPLVELGVVGFIRHRPLEVNLAVCNEGFGLFVIIGTSDKPVISLRAAKRACEQSQAPTPRHSG